MVPSQWSNLPGDILSIILKLLNSDADLLRLRSVCSSWRSSLPSRTSPISFPLKVPSLLSKSDSDLLHRNSPQFLLNYSTLYRLSPPGPGDSPDGWLLRVSEVNPNTFSLLTPLLPDKINSTPGTIPESLNLLDFRISEICKCYGIGIACVDLNNGLRRRVPKKVIVLHNYVAECEFAVLVMVSGKDMRFWKLGDRDWTCIDTRGYDFDDVILFHGKCYAIGWKGVLVSFDSEFNLTVVSSSNESLAYNYNNFVIFKSDLYVVSKISDQEPDEYSSDFEGRYSGADEDDECTDEDNTVDEDEYIDEEYIGTDDDEEEDAEETDPVEISLRMKIFRMSDDGWERVGCLGDDTIFLSSDDVAVGVSAKDFGGCKGNCVYLAHKRVQPYEIGIDHGDHHGVYDLDRSRTRTLILDSARDRSKIYWPPPYWLYN